MASIWDMKPAFVDMTTEERFEVVKGIRASRRERKPRPAAKKRAESKKRSQSKTIEEKIGGLSPSMAAALLRTLEIEKKIKDVSPSEADKLTDSFNKELFGGSSNN